MPYFKDFDDAEFYELMDKVRFVLFGVEERPYRLDSMLYVVDQNAHVTHPPAQLPLFCYYRPSLLHLSKGMLS